MRWLPLCLGLLLPLGAQAAEPVRFSDALYKKFQHPRCVQCHQFNSQRNNGRAYTTHRSRYLCDNCHTSFLTGLSRGDWMAPNERLDWTGLGPGETCELIKRNLGAGDLRQKMTQHLLQDVRVRWALESGMTPAGRFPAVPGGYQAWATEVRAWIDGGMLCE